MALISKLKTILSYWEQPQMTVHTTSLEAVCSALEALNCKFQKEEHENGNTVVYFKYQGLNFRAFLFQEKDNTNCNLDFHAGIYGAEELELIRQTCNQANSSVFPIHFYYIANTKENVFNIYATCTLTNVTEIIDLKKELEKSLEQFFNARMSFEDAMHKQKEADVPEEEELFMGQHEIWMARELEMLLQETKDLPKDTDAAHLLLTDFLEAFFNIQSVEIESVDICTGDEAKHITDTERIHSLLLLDPVVSNLKEPEKASAKKSCATITVYFLSADGEANNIMINLRVENDTKQALYVRVTSMQPGESIGTDVLLDSSNNTPDAFSLLLAVDHKTEANKRAEVKYMWEEACKKSENGEKLTEDEQYLQSIAAVPHLVNSAYLGRKLFNQKRYAEALPYFSNVNEYLESNFFENFWCDELRQYFAHNSYYLGHCYFSLGDATRATYYLEKACLIYPSPLHQMTFIKALYASNDFRLIHEIRTRIDELDEIGNKMKEEETFNDAQSEMYEFLQRAMVLALILHRKWEDAKHRLQYIIDNAGEELKEWAKEKMAEIEKMKKEKK